MTEPPAHAETAATKRAGAATSITRSTPCPRRLAPGISPVGGLLVVDGRRRAERSGSFELLVARRRDDHIRPAAAEGWARRSAHPGAKHEDSLAGAQRIDLEERVPRRQRRAGQRGGILGDK
jgi:hypothetical protein